MLDRERLLSKLAEAESYAAELEEIGPRDLATYVSDGVRRRACERVLQIGIESLIDAAELLVAGGRLGLPEDEERALGKLAERGLVAHADVQLLMGMRKFRNVLVHRYGKVDHALAHANLVRAPRDFRHLVREFKAAAERLGGK